MGWLAALAPFNVTNVKIGSSIESSKEKSLRAETPAWTKKQWEQKTLFGKSTAVLIYLIQKIAGLSLTIHLTLHCAISGSFNVKSHHSILMALKWVKNKIFQFRIPPPVLPLCHHPALQRSIMPISSAYCSCYLPQPITFPEFEVNYARKLFVLVEIKVGLKDS